MTIDTYPTMDEERDALEQPMLRITADDVDEANQLSLACPICASPVENYVRNPALQAVSCTRCGTLHHKACFEQGGGVCGMVGCDSKTVRAVGQMNGSSAPILTINKDDIRRGQRGRRSRSTKELKEQERRMQREVSGGGILRAFFDWLLRQIRILDE